MQEITFPLAGDNLSFVMVFTGDLRKGLMKMGVEFFPCCFQLMETQFFQDRHEMAVGQLNPFGQGLDGGG